MKRLALVVLLACGGEHATPPSAPIAVDVAPAAPITSGPLAQSPPPNPARSEREVPLPPPAEETTTLVPLPSNGTQPFDRGAAANALAGAPIQRCSVPGGPTGHGHVTVLWDQNGTVASVTVDQGPFPGTAVGGCLAKVYSTPPFAGTPVRVGKSFVLN
jgi:hypothetical protein